MYKEKMQKKRRKKLYFVAFVFNICHYEEVNGIFFIEIVQMFDDSI